MADPDRPGRRRRRPHPLLLAAALYLLAVLLLNARVLPDLNSETTGWISADSHTFTWWLQWFPTALARGQSPLFTDYVHYPYGVNAMWNISVPVLAALFMPVTLVVGPVAAYNVAMLLGPVVSGLLMAVALRPWTHRWLSRVVGGGIYAFSPFLVAHFSVGHLNLVWAILPPVLLMTVRALFVQTPRSPVLAGALVGVALTVQLGLYTQTLALGVLVLVLVAVVLAARWPRAVPGRLPTIARMAAGALPTFLLLGAYPLWLVLAGPARPRGVIRPALEVRADLLNVVLPTSLTVGGAEETADRLNAYIGEQGGYLGPVMLLLFVVACVTARTAAMRVVAVVGLLVWVFSLGPSLTTGKDDLDVWLPWRLLENVPLLGLAEPVRLQVFTGACAAMIVALWIDRVGTLPRGGRRTAGAVLAVAAVVSWLPGRVTETADATAPPFFPMAGAHLRHTDVAVTFPRPDGTWVGGGRPILWQALSGMAYRTTGGSFLSSDPDHDILFATPENLFEGAARGLLDGLPPPDAGYTTAARAQLADTGVTVLLVVPEPGEDWTRVREWAAAVAGDPGEHIGGVWLYRLT